MKTPLRCALLIFAFTSFALAQGRSGGGKPPTAFPGPNGPNFPTNGIPLPPTAPNSLFVSGQVVLDDGTELTEPVIIQTICRGQKYSDTHGGFSFQFGDPRPGAIAAISDASSSNAPDRSTVQSTRDLAECQLQAELAGFTSQPVELGSRSSLMNSIEVGRVPLHRLAHVDGTSISVTSALAPPPARKAFEKALALEKKGKWDEAQKSLEKSVQLYPRYATAWYQLGRLQLQNRANRDLESAKHSFEQAVAADPKYVNPYDGLAQLAMLASDWHGVIDITGKLLALNPVNFPDAYYDCAVANYRLKNFEDAEKSALQGIRVDDAHQIPKLQYVLAVIFLQRQNFQAASEHMQLYLHLAKDPDEIELAKKGLAEIEKSSARAQPPVIDLDK
jgi:tetratricopeptide (TPR) repeat protein